jgi:microcystin-dependent protein
MERRSKATYANLYSVIGNHFGTPIDASLNFLLPDLRAKFPVGNNGSTYSLGNTGGHSAVTLTSNQMPAHSHSGTTNSSGAHSHSVTDPGHVHSHTDAYFAENTGGGANNVFGTSAGTDYDNSYRYRPDATTSSSITGISIGSNGSHTHDFTTNETGGGESVNIMPPYLVVNYLIKY